ncbi:hypothetical protein [uncultured Algibacter sp.]|uniref:hypothetical protein n=1 Tax=uncultured Algibacter sp. TaxID=298659 RepID=UPI003217ECB8
MNNESIIGIVSFIIVALFLLFSAFLLTVKTNKKLSNQLLASFLIITAIDISVFFLPQFHRTSAFYRNVENSNF